VPSGEIATAYTLAFVRDHLPRPVCSILEVGCGGGELAAALVAAGHEVLAIDSDADCVAASRSLGVNAIQAEWPARLDRQFDAVLFTRSLHHVFPLDGAIAAAIAGLGPNGKVIVEDFRSELESARNTAWFTGLVRTLDAAGELSRSCDPSSLLAKTDQDEHRHELHASDAIAAQLKARGFVSEEDAAYYFRYIEPAVSPAVAERTLQLERAMIEADAIDALGRRFVLTPSS
jgi:SAM-dependent methyltransferase